MNERTTIYIDGVDNTGPAVKSATKNFRDLNKEVKKDYEDYKGHMINTRAIRERAKESNLSYDQLLANHKKAIDGENALVNKHRQAGQAAVQAGQQGGSAFKFMGAQIPPIVGGLARMAGGALTAYEALNQLKQGFMGFAAFDNQLRLTRNQTGLSEQKIHDLGTEMKRLAAITGVSSKELLEAFNEIREAGNFTPEEALKMMPDLTTAANGANANAKLFNRAVGDIMRNLKIPADQYKYVMEAFSHANSQFNINIEEMGPRLSQATAYMATWGYQGVDAMQRAVTLFGVLKEGTGSAAKAGSALIGILGDLGNDRMGKALGFGAGQLEKYLRSVQDPIGELISLMTQADNQDLVMKALDIQDKASYTRLMGELRTFADKLKGVREAQGAVARGKYVEAGPEFAIKRLMTSLEELRNSLGLLLNAIGVTAGIEALAATMTAIATSVERIVGGLKYIVGLSDVMPKGMPKSWAEFKYSQWAKTPQDFGGEGDQPIVPYADYERGGQEYYDKTVKEFQEKLDKEQLEGIAKAKKAREDAADQEREKLDADSRKRFPNYVIPERPGRGPGVSPMLPPHEPSARPRLLPTPLLPTPSPGRPEGMLQKMGSALDDATKKLVSFAEALPDSERAQLVRAAFTPRAYGVRMGAGPTSGEGTTGAGTRNIGVETEARRAEEGRTYGGSGDARVLPASYTPSGRGYLWGGPGGARGPGDTGPGGAGPGGLGTDYGPRGSLARGATRGGDGPTGPTGPTTGPAASGKIGERIATAKEAMEDQLRKEGVPEANIKEAANLLAGQALTESKLQPDTSHDSGTGYGIYGARLERRTAMFNWLDKHGYARNSLEGQSRYMAHEAMSGKYKRTRAALMGADPTNRAQNVSTLTSEFENPKDQSEFQMKNRRGWTATATGTPTKGSTPATPVTSTETPDTGSPTSTLPAGKRISSGVGERVHPITGRRKLHAGTDTPGPAGSEFRSRHGGKVTGVNEHGDVTVQNEDGTTSTYRHVDPNVKVGDTVAEGQPLGTLKAKDPRSTGPHLHEEKRDAQGRLLDTAAEDRAKIAAQQAERARVAATPAPRTGSARAAEPVERPAATPVPATPTTQERDLQLNVKVNDAQVQFARTSMRRSADREVREARWNSYSDIGAA